MSQNDSSRTSGDSSPRSDGLLVVQRRSSGGPAVVQTGRSRLQTRGAAQWRAIRMLMSRFCCRLFAHESPTSPAQHRPFSTLPSPRHAAPALRCVGAVVCGGSAALPPPSPSPPIGRLFFCTRGGGASPVLPRPSCRAPSCLLRPSTGRFENRSRRDRRHGVETKHASARCRSLMGHVRPAREGVRPASHRPRTRHRRYKGRGFNSD